MKILIKSTVMAVALSFTTLYAADGHSHSGHNHASHDALKKEMTNTAIKKIAKQEVKRLALEKKIAKSWKTMPISKLGKTHHADTNDWVVVFENLKIKNKARQSLYIFVSVHGDITGANYTGD